MTIPAAEKRGRSGVQSEKGSGLRTKEQYIEGLRKMRRNLHYNGALIDRDDELQQPALDVMGVTFEAAFNPELKDLCTATSHLMAKTISRFCHIHQNTADLHKKQDMTRALCRKVGFCIQRCMGIDAVNAVNAVSYEADKLGRGNTASALAKPELYMPGLGSVPYGPGSCIPHSIYANVGRCLTGEAVFKEQEMLCSIAGGLPATFPNEADIHNPELRPLLEKYLNRNPRASIEEQIKFRLLYIDYSCSGFTGPMNYGNFHGGGSPIMEQIAITSQYDLKLREHLVNYIAGVEALKPGALTTL